MRTYDDSDGLVPGMTMLVRPGHTLTSDVQTMLLMGGLLHSEEVQFAEPDIAFALDEDKDETVASRSRILADAATDTGLPFAHVSFPGIGYIRRAGDGFEWVPRQYGVDAAR